MKENILLTRIFLSIDKMCQLVLPSFAGGILPHRFWSSVELTGNQTSPTLKVTYVLFWSSVELTGNQTNATRKRTLQ